MFGTVWCGPLKVYVSKWQLVCKFVIVERYFLLMFCFYHCLYTSSKFYLLFFALIWFYFEIAFLYEVLCIVTFHRRSPYSLVFGKKGRRKVEKCFHHGGGYGGNGPKTMSPRRPVFQGWLNYLTYSMLLTHWGKHIIPKGTLLLWTSILCCKSHKII